jgi:hypothetical protein
MWSLPRAARPLAAFVPVVSSLLLQNGDGARTIEFLRTELERETPMADPKVAAHRTAAI